MKLGLLLLLSVACLSGCAIETPKAYLSVPGTPVKIYGYAGGGIALEEDE